MRRKGSVLLMEDDPGTAGTTMALVESLGYSATWVRDRSEALFALSATRIDVIMLDLITPRLDGLFVLEHLQRTRSHLLARVILTTGIPDRYLDNLDRGRICGVIEKPLDAGQLERLLDHCAARVHLPSAGAGEVPELFD
jgi:CheY-like chemotaxis protein